MKWHLMIWDYCILVWCLALMSAPPPSESWHSFSTPASCPHADITFIHRFESHRFNSKTSVLAFALSIFSFFKPYLSLSLTVEIDQSTFWWNDLHRPQDCRVPLIFKSKLKSLFIRAGLKLPLLVLFYTRWFLKVGNTECPSELVRQFTCKIQKQYKCSGRTNT